MEPCTSKHREVPSGRKGTVNSGPPIMVSVALTIYAVGRRILVNMHVIDSMAGHGGIKCIVGIHAATNMPSTKATSLTSIIVQHTIQGQ